MTRTRMLLAAAAFAVASLAACDAKKPLPKGRFHGPSAAKTQTQSPAETQAAPWLDAVFLGETTYRVLLGPERLRLGTAVLRTSRTERRDLEVLLDLDLTDSGVPLAESRRLVVGSDGAFRAASLSREGVKVADCYFQLDGAWWSFVKPTGGRSEPSFAPVAPRDAVTRLGFVLAAAVGGTMPRLERRLYDESALEGEARPLVFEEAGAREVETAGARRPCRVVALRVEGERRREALVGGDGRVVRVDWTADVVLEAEDPPSPLVQDLPGLAPDAAWARFTDPREVRRWWATQAQVSAAQGGVFALGWPETGHGLRGTVRESEPGRRLVVAWRRAGRPDETERTLEVSFAPQGSGTRVEVLDAFAPPGGDAERAWRVRLARLAELR